MSWNDWILKSSYTLTNGNNINHEDVLLWVCVLTGARKLLWIVVCELLWVCGLTWARKFQRGYLVKYFSLSTTYYKMRNIQWKRWSYTGFYLSSILWIITFLQHKKINFIIYDVHFMFLMFQNFVCNWSNY